MSHYSSQTKSSLLYQCSSKYLDLRSFRQLLHQKRDTSVSQTNRKPRPDGSCNTHIHQGGLKKTLSIQENQGASLWTSRHKRDVVQVAKARINFSFPLNKMRHWRINPLLHCCQVLLWLTLSNFTWRLVINGTFWKMWCLSEQFQGELTLFCIILDIHAEKWLIPLRINT